MGQGLAELSKKCQELLSIRDEIGNLQKALNDKMKDEEHMSGTVIPNMMTELGIRSLHLMTVQLLKSKKNIDHTFQMTIGQMQWEWFESKQS
jgi:hypothetical protein